MKTRRPLRALAFVLSLSPVFSTTSGLADPAAREAALSAIASGRLDEGISTLRKAAGSNEGNDPELVCLLGRFELIAGRFAEAERTFARVPADAVCGRQAAFGRADALVALKRADEAATLYAQYGAESLGPDRDRAVTAWIEQLAGRALGEDDANLATNLYALAFQRQLSPAARIALGQRVAEVLKALPPEKSPSTAPDGLAEALLQGLLARDDAAARRLVARFLPASEGLDLLLALPADPATLEVAAELALEVDVERALPLLDQLAASKVAPDVAQKAARQAAMTRGKLGRLGAPLRTLAAGTGDQARDASNLELDLLEQAGDRAALVTAAERHLQRFPADPHRTENEQRLDRARLDLGRIALAAGRHAEAIKVYDALVTRDPRSDDAPVAAWEAALAARAAGLKSAAGGQTEAERRLEELLARWPDTTQATQAVAALTRIQAFDRADPAGALVALDVREREGTHAAAASEERERLKSPYIALRTTPQPPNKAKVQVIARNLAEVEARLHKIDPEAYLRAGGAPDSLPDLDVAVIAPDERWKVKVPGFVAQKDVAFDLAVPDVKPGLYVITVASEDREASAVLWISQVRLLAHTEGPDLVAAAFRGETPADDVEILVRLPDGRIERGETDKNGLMRKRLPKMGNLTLLALDDGAPALVALARDDADLPTATVQMSADLDRPIWLPGDTLHYRVVARKEGRPLRGTFSVWLDGEGSRASAQKVEATALGTFSGALTVPPTVGGTGPWRRRMSLMVQAPGEDAPQPVASVEVAPQGPPERRLEVEMVGTSARITVREADDGPVAGVRIAWTAQDGREGHGTTDARGRVEVAGPPAQLGWQLSASVDGTDLRGAANRILPERMPLALMVGDAPAGGVVRGELRGEEGTYELTWAPVVQASKRPDAPVDPWVPAFELGLTGADGELKDVPTPAPPAWVEREAQTREVVIKDGRAPIELPGLASGAWSVRAARRDGTGTTAHMGCRVADPLPGLAGVRSVRLGDTLTLTAVGSRPGLLMVGSDRVLGVAVVRPGGTLTLPVTTEWGTSVQAYFTDITGQSYSQVLEVDPSLKVSLTAGDTADQLGWHLQARVTDGAGRPVAAEVAVRVVDDTLIDQAGQPAELLTSNLELRFTEGRRGAAFAEVVHAVEAEAIAAELMAEAAREAEASKARRAASGRLQMNAVSDVMAAPPLDNGIGLGGMGTLGHGAGGGGYGRGMGQANVRVGKASVLGARFVAGERSDVAWAVLTTGANGEATVDVPRPRRATHWTLSANAVAALGYGQATLPLDTTGTLRLRAPQPGPGAPGETLEPVAYVHNGSAATLAGTVKVGGKAVAVSVGPGEATAVPMGPQTTGNTVELVLEVGGRVVDRLVWAAPLGEGRPDPAGQVLHIATAPGGGLPAAHLALRPDVAFGADAGRTAIAGRAALAALAFAAPSERPALEARIAQVRATLRSLHPSGPRAAAEVLTFMAEARTRLSIPRGEIEAAAEAVGSPGADPEERAAVLYARAAAGLEVDASALARLERTENLPPEVSARLARLLILQGRKADAGALIQGAGPHALLARAALDKKDDAGRKALGSQPPPGVGTWALPDWIAAAGQSPGSAQGTASLRVGGQVVGTLDRARGGELRVATTAPAGPVAVELDGVNALVWRSGPADVGEAAPNALRLPVGLDGAPIGAQNPRYGGEGAERCGEPCVVAVGDALTTDGDLDAPGLLLPSGLPRMPVQGGFALRAMVPGRYVLRGLRGEDGLIRPLTIEVKATAGPEGLTRTHALQRAEQAVAAQADPAPWLAPWPADGDWPDGLLALRASVRFTAALQNNADAATQVDRFEALREANPSESLTSEQVAVVAKAYQASGRAARSVDVWRVGLGGAFLAEAAAARQVEDVAGLLASLQGLRQVAARYPALPAVEEALFYLPQRLDQMAAEGNDLPEPVVRAKITRTDLRLMAGAWDREFIALWPKSTRRAEAAFHLVSTLQVLEAHAEAARFAETLAQQLADSPLLDGLLYLQGLSRLRLREDARARELFDRISKGEFPQEDGSEGPAQSRDDARYALARLYEARGDLKAAKAAYEEAAASNEDAAEAAKALTEVTLRAERFTHVEGGDTLQIPLTLANLETVNLRAYRLDLRTIFLRDGSLDEVLAVNVSGVSPIWSDERDVDTDHFPREYKLKLPLSERGAYLIQIDGGGATATALVVRSDLELNATPGDEGLRVAVRLKGKPAAGIALRSAGNGSVRAASTDVRGVGTVEGPNVLAFTDAGDVAFTTPTGWAAVEEPEELQTYRQSIQGRGPAAAPAPRKSNIDLRLQQQMERNEGLYEQNFRKDGNANIDANML